MKHNKSVAIVTGAGNGIGRAIALKFAQEGISVGLLDVDRPALEACHEEIQSKNLAKSVSKYCDVGNSNDVTEAIEVISIELGSPLILVNNAGFGGPFHRIDEVSDEEWDFIMNTNLRSVFLFCRKLLPTMRDASYGKIINIASIQGLFGTSLSSTYIASKHGVIGYTKAIAAEWGRYNICCNAICPGYINTKMGVQDNKIPNHSEKIISRTPSNMIGKTEQVADLAYFLIGSSADYINGSSYVIDGGITADLQVS